MYEALAQIIPPHRIRNRYIDRVSYASDAGFYHLIPEAVVFPENEAEITALFHYSRQHQKPLVFRCGGTSLSGQSITDGILVDLTHHWKKAAVEEEGRLVRVQPGITGARVNARLKPFGRKIGPDPSSISAAMMGGILSNNSSGMCCGVKLNSYHTLKYIRFILPDGQAFTTESADDYPRFAQDCRKLYQTLQDIRNQLLLDQPLQERIRSKYQIKNTIGYSLNAFLDYEHPLDILAHLLIGAEGTLAFIAEAVLVTVPDYRYKSTALLFFPDIFSACSAIVPLNQSGALMVELMDRASLRSVEDLKGMPDLVKTLPEQAAALLVEFQQDDQASLAAQVNAFLQSAASLSLLNAPEFTNDPVQQEFYWKMRKGLVPAIGAMRASGTSVILEDIAMPVEKIGEAILELQSLFRKYGYHQAIIFGHAKDGNIHFVVTQSFNSAEEIRRYDAFTREMVSLVVDRFSGSLKAEHGTGRNMAPFVETEWGGTAYEIIRRIKKAVDPHGYLNPGVIVNEHADAHLRDLKELPRVEEEVDRCMECGFCEQACPSRELTTSPRRRIVARRVLKQLQDRGETQQYELLLKEYQYEGIDTCAVDGLCATTCPVDINTGDLIKRLRCEQHSRTANWLAEVLARNFRWVVALMRIALYTGTLLNHWLGRHTMTRLTTGLRKHVPAVPLWTEQLVRPPRLGSLKASKTSAAPQASGNAVVYFPACITRALGTYSGKSKNLMETFRSICEKTGFEVVIPEAVNSLCCGQLFSSKGYNRASQHIANAVIQNLWKASREGAVPVVIDVSSCAYTLQQLRPLVSPENKVKWDRIRFMDSVVFLHDLVMPRVQFSRRKKAIVLHPVCSLRKMQAVEALVNVARRCADTVVVPESAGCCGMAGDRGFRVPELTESAIRDEAASLTGQTFDGYYASTKTCEMALSASVRKEYESILYLVDESL